MADGNPSTGIHISTFLPDGQPPQPSICKRAACRFSYNSLLPTITQAPMSPLAGLSQLSSPPCTSPFCDPRSWKSVGLAGEWRGGENFWKDPVHYPIWIGSRKCCCLLRCSVANVQHVWLSWVSFFPSLIHIHNAHGMLLVLMKVGGGVRGRKRQFCHYFFISNPSMTTKLHKLEEIMREFQLKKKREKWHNNCRASVLSWFFAGYRSSTG